jgi:hypothetical protein
VSFTENAESVVPIQGFPQSSVGAPCPAVIATEHLLVLVFELEDQDLDGDDTTSVDAETDSYAERCAVIQFERPSIHKFGPPNDETFEGHRLARKGLRPYGAYEVMHSAWIQELEQLNAIHPLHNRERFLAGKRHFIITFHDSVFECVARGYSVKLASGPIKSLIAAYAAKINT